MRCANLLTWELNRYGRWRRRRRTTDDGRRTTLSFYRKSLHARKGKIKYRRATYKIRRRVYFFVLLVAQVERAKDFFSDELHTRARTLKPLNPPGLVCRKKRGMWERKEHDQGRWSVATRRGREKKERPRKVVCRHKNGTWEKRKEEDQGRRGGSSAKARFRLSSTKKFLFLVHEYLGLEAARLVWSIGSNET